MLRYVIPLLFFALPLEAATVYTATKEFPWEWGEAPADLESGMDRIRGWLEAKKAPRLLDASRPLRKETIRYHDLELPVTVKFAVMGPPRSTSGHDPFFYAWIEWVTKSKFAFDQDEKRYERKAGIAKVAIEGSGEKKVEIREWHWEKDLRDKELEKIFPWDAAVIVRKMLDFHLHRPRVLPEKANGPGKHSLY